MKHTSHFHTGLLTTVYIESFCALLNVLLALVSPSVIEAVSLQGWREEVSLVSTGSYVVGNTSLDFQKGTDRQTLRTHGPLSADYNIKVKQMEGDRLRFIAKQPEDFQLLMYIFY